MYIVRDDGAVTWLLLYLKAATIPHCMVGRVCHSICFPIQSASKYPHTAYVTSSSSQPQVFIADGVDSATEYIFTYDSGSESLQFTQPCTGSLCQHTFRVTNSSQVQQYTVSVAVRNVVGVGTASAPVTIGM